MEKIGYWKECVSLAAEEVGLKLTAEQLEAIADSVQVGHENCGMAFYDPGWGERMSDIEDEWKKKYAALQAEFDAYRNDAETAVKRALRQYSDANVSIGKHGEVLRHDGRTEQIQ